MDKVFNVQTEGGQGEIQDYDLHQQTAVQTVAATDYVMLQDTNGAYHKILRNSLVDALRDVLGASIGGAALGTDIQKIPALGTNDALGFGTLANIASVLGGFRFINVENGGDLNNCTELACYQGNGSNVSNSPFGAAFSVWVFPRDSATNGIVCIQIAIAYQSLGYKIRKQWGNGSWSNWEQLATDLPPFYKDYSDLASLATAINVFQTSSETNIDDLKTAGCYKIDNVEGSNYVVVWNFGDVVIQIVFYVGPYMYISFRTYNTNLGWHEKTINYNNTITGQ